MPEAENQNTNLESRGASLQELVGSIYFNNPTSQELDLIRGKQIEILGTNDPAGIELNNSLRDSLAGLDTSPGGEQTKQKARSELSLIPSDFLEQILRRFEPFMKNLPAGHDKGHMLRDTINLMGILSDPKLETEKIDEVELFVGITAGVFHDIGNSIVNRYEDVNRVGAHAEVGAVLFGEIAKDLIPANLMKLIQYSIAAHTHYPSNRQVKVGETSFTPRAYNDISQGREAIWLARQADRRDTSSLPQILRDMIIHVEPIQDFDGQKHYERQKEEENFSVYYGFSPETFDQSLIAHEMKYCRNVYTENSYTSHDSDYFTEVLMTPGVGDVLLFLSVVAPERKEELLAGIEQIDSIAAGHLKNELAHYSDTVKSYAHYDMGGEDIVDSIAKYERVCRVVVPAADLEDRLEAFKAQFPLLTSEDHQNWAKGLSFMSDVLFRRWRNRLSEGVAMDPRLGDKISSPDRVTRQQFHELGQHLQRIAKQIIASMDEAAANP